MVENSCATLSQCVRTIASNLAREHAVNTRCAFAYLLRERPGRNMRSALVAIVLALFSGIGRDGLYSYWWQRVVESVTHLQQDVATEKRGEILLEMVKTKQRRSCWDCNTFGFHATATALWVQISMQISMQISIILYMQFSQRIHPQ